MTPQQIDAFRTHWDETAKTDPRLGISPSDFILCEIALQLASINQALLHQTHIVEADDPGCPLCQARKLREALARDCAREHLMRQETDDD